MGKEQAGPVPEVKVRRLGMLTVANPLERWLSEECVTMEENVDFSQSLEMIGFGKGRNYSIILIDPK